MKPAQHIEQIPTADLVPYARNARTHSPAQVAGIAGSIREFGFNNPVLIDKDNGIIAGHGRVMAAQQLGLDTVPCLRLGHLTKTQRKAYILADNRLAELAGWDTEMLALEIADLRLDDVDLELLGFDDDGLKDLLGEGEPEQGLTDPDATPEVPVTPISKPGDLWILGNHRLLCGDSTQVEAVALVLDGEISDLMLTDPPYGIGRDKGAAPGGKITSGLCKRNPKQYVGGWDDDRCPDAVLLGLQHAKKAIVWGANYYTDIFPLNGKWLVWDKEQTMPTYSDAEIAWTSLDGVSVKMFRYSGNGLLAKEKTRYHPTQKPIALLEWCLEQSKDAHTLYEPFSGSGSTIIAAEQTSRRCYAIEISPAYVDVAVRRWQEFTGQTATHAETGQPFPAHG